MAAIPFLRASEADPTGVGERLPPLRVYEQPPIPALGSIWTPGYSASKNYQHFWVLGAWVEPTRPGLLLTPGYWGVGGGVYLFDRGYWRRRVGCHGGIAYGFGYGGVRL